MTFVPMMGRTLQGPEGPPAPLRLSIPESIALPVDRWHARRALGPYSLTLAYFGFRHGGTNYALDITHGIGADATAQNASMAGRTRIAVTLADSAQDAEAVCDAMITALDGVGITATRGTATTDRGVEVCTLSIDGASGYVAAPSIPLAHETTRGMRGSIRTDFGSSDLGSSAAVGATPSAHLLMGSSAGRTRGVYALNTSGAANVRAGLADGPAYSTTPAAFSAGAEGIMTIGVAGLRLLPLAPRAFSSASNKWISWRAAAGGNPSVAFRVHASSPVGNGGLVVGEQLLSSTVSSNPATAIYTGGAYTHGSPVSGSPFSVYASWGVLYELPDGDGDYPGDGSIETYHGYHGPATGGTGTGSPAQADSATLETLTESFRRTIPWGCEVVGVRFSVSTPGGSDSCGIAIYDFTGITLAANPAVGTIERLTPEATISAGVLQDGEYTEVTLPTPIVVAANAVVADTYAWAAPSGTLATNYDPPGTAGAYLSGWIDDAAAFCDMVDSGPGARGVDAQYLTQASGDMPTGDGAATVWPDVFDQSATDLRPQNHFRAALRIRRRGIERV